MTRGDILTAWKARISDLSDAELFEVCSNLITCLISDMPTANTAEEAEFVAMLTKIRDETLERYRLGDHVSSPARGHG